MVQSGSDVDGGDHVPRPMLTVAAVARRLGVAPATLRTWDRRYGVGPSEHAAGSHRRYSGVDVARLMLMRQFTLDGVPPAEAAAIARVSEVRDEAELATVTVLNARTVPVEGPGGPAWTALEAADRTTEHQPSSHARTGGGRVLSLPDGSPAARGLARAAMTLDSHECNRLIRQHIDRHGTVATWDHLIAPVLIATGDRWHTTGDGIEVEHLLSECILSSLRTVAAGLRHPRNTRPVLLAAAEQEQHGLPLHVLTAALAEQGVGTRLLGVRVPRAALAAAIRRSGPAVVFVYAQVHITVAAQLKELPRLRPSPLILLGGPGWHGVDTPPGAERVHNLTEATNRIMTAVGL